MTRTRPSILLLLALLGGGAGWFLETALVASGRAAFIPPVTLAAALALIGVIVVVIAWPVFRVVRGTAKTRVDPFYATRAVVLAKASSITGGLLGGAAAGILIFFLSRSVPANASIGMATATVVAGAVLLAGGLIAEKMCTLPPQDDDPSRPPTGEERA